MVFILVILNKLYCFDIVVRVLPVPHSLQDSEWFSFGTTEDEELR